MFNAIWNFVKSTAKTVWGFIKAVFTPRLVSVIKFVALWSFVGCLFTFVLVLLGISFGWLVLLVPFSTFLLIMLQATIKTVLEMVGYAVMVEFFIRGLEWLFASKNPLVIEA